MISNEELVYKKNFIWEKLNGEEKQKVFTLGDEYKKFLDSAKTERLSIKEIIKMAESFGFKDIRDLNELKEGTKVYHVNKDKSAVLAQVYDLGTVSGSEYVEEGTMVETTLPKEYVNKFSEYIVGED